MSAAESSAWAEEISQKDALTGSPLVALLIKRLQLSSHFLEVSAVSIDWIWDQFALHIPYKIGVDLSEQMIVNATGGGDQAEEEEEGA